MRALPSLSARAIVRLCAVSMVQEGTELLLVRHGETEWNVQGRLQGAADSPLTAVGEADAVKCRDRLARGSRAPCVCYTSPLGRARKTAEILCAGTSIPIVDDDGLVERSFGVLEGLTVEERKAQFPDVKLRSPDDDYAPPGGESRSSTQARAVAALKAIAERHPGERVLVVTHSGWLSSGMRAVLGMPYNVVKGSGLALPNTAINLLRWEGAGWQVQLWGERGEFGERQVRRVGELSELGFAFAMGAAFALFVRRALALVI